MGKGRGKDMGKDMGRGRGKDMGMGKDKGMGMGKGSGRGKDKGMGMGKGSGRGREVIKKFIREIQPASIANEATEDHNAAALLARLAHADLLIYSTKEIEENYVEKAR